MEPLFQQTLQSQSSGDGGMGHPQNHTFPSVPMPQARPACHPPGAALPWHSGGQGFDWHGAGGPGEPPEQGAAPLLPESPAGCGCEQQVWAGEGCLEFVSRSRERQEQILIINNPAGWRLCRHREGGRQRSVAKQVWGESGQHSFIAVALQRDTAASLTALLSWCQFASGDGILNTWRTIAG